MHNEKFHILGLKSSVKEIAKQQFQRQSSVHTELDLLYGVDKHVVVTLPCLEEFLKSIH